MNKAFLFVAAATATFSLGSWTYFSIRTVDLTEKGIPVIVDMPDDSEITEGIGHGTEFMDVTTYVWEVIGDDLSLEVTMDNDEMWQEAEEYIADAKEIAIDIEGAEIIQSDKMGFIYETTTEGITEYGFYHLMIKDGYAIEFAQGIYMDWDSLDNMKKVYAIAQKAR